MWMLTAGTDLGVIALWMPYDRGRRSTTSCAAGTDSRVNAPWRPRVTRSVGGSAEFRAADLRAVARLMDVLTVGEVKRFPQERAQQRVDCVEVVQCEQEQERISERTVEQTDLLFVAGRRMCTSVA